MSTPNSNPDQSQGRQDHQNQKEDSRSQLYSHRFWYAFFGDKTFFISVFVFLILAGLSFAAPLVAPYNPYDLASIDILDSEIPPVWEEEGNPDFILGTDQQGRDLLSTILYGMRISLIISICAVILQSLIGLVLGLLAGYIGGWVDAFIMRLADIQLSFSTLMLAIISLALIKTFFSIDVYEQVVVYVIIIVIGLSEWPQYARTVRAGVMVEKKKEYVEAAECLGFSKRVIIFRHIAPNILSPIFVISTIQVANAIISETAISFLGLGIPPTQPSLGMLIQNGFENLLSGAWWISIIPSLFLILLVLAINNIGDWARDYFNPKQVQD